MDNDMRYTDNFTEKQVKSFYRKVYSFVEAVLIVLITLFSIIFMCILIALSVIIGVFHLIAEDCDSKLLFKE